MEMVIDINDAINYAGRIARQSSWRLHRYKTGQADSASYVSTISPSL